MSKVEQGVAKIASLAEKLLLEVVRLNADVTRLHGQITPFENEPVQRFSR